MCFMTKIASGTISKIFMILIMGLLCANPSAFPLNVRDDKPVISFTPGIPDNQDHDQNLKVQESILKLLKLGNGKILGYTSVYALTGLTWENYPANPHSLADSGISFAVDGISTLSRHIKGYIVQNEDETINGQLRSSIGASLFTVGNSVMTQAQLKKNPKKKGGTQKASSLPQVFENSNLGTRCRDVEAAEVAPVSLAELPVAAEDAFKPEVGVLVADTRVPVLVLFRIAVDVVTLTTDSVVDRRSEDEVPLIKDALEDVGGKLEILVLAEKKDEVVSKTLEDLSYTYHQPESINFAKKKPLSTYADSVVTKAELELGVASVKDEESWPHAVMESAKRRNADDNFIRKVNDHRMITLRINTSGRWKIPDFTKVWCAPVSRQKLELTGAPNSNSRNAELEEEGVNIAGRGRGPSKKFSPVR
ncbi:hypothetical protein EV368DRAFT_68587 [Lentinula lateritia]|nr:hypothetical protein EV368DRAFT_68587 [Lentinula lateritia]